MRAWGSPSGDGRLFACPVPTDRERGIAGLHDQIGERLAENFRDSSRVRTGCRQDDPKQCPSRNHDISTRITPKGDN